MVGQIIAEVLVYSFIDIVFYTLCYITGAFLTPIVTLGKLKPADCERDKEARKAKRKYDPGIVYTYQGDRYLSANFVSLVGLCFWVMIGVMIFVLYA